jgi:hypothetical protein
MFLFLLKIFNILNFWSFRLLMRILRLHVETSACKLLLLALLACSRFTALINEDLSSGAWSFIKLRKRSPPCRRVSLNNYPSFPRGQIVTWDLNARLTNILLHVHRVTKYFLLFQSFLIFLIGLKLLLVVVISEIYLLKWSLINRCSLLKFFL